ncbi:putative sugar nucleotidyl transferase [Chitinophaga qingshengii]|uniref:Glucose-1-phosphate thymidylyltransferase n=1 Tax=Chitinophaga qingshengii TaxID=1569794 RepID=A0ABR7TN20_9BACT|nr:putative sugar nucleotidyl transferase [Chitinophaga qingshengii]MBC9931880.1 glucose-1-phosphate thymidylyltransferase [Chitinophaga qingshengii]
MERNYILFDTPERDLLYPFTHTRPIAACRVGILTIQEKWEHWLGADVSHFTVPYLQEKYPLQRGGDTTVNILISGHIMPDAALVAAIGELAPDEELYKDNRLIAKKIQGREVHLLPAVSRKNYTGPVAGIFRPWDIFMQNDRAIREDFARLTEGRSSAPLPEGCQVSHPENIFLEPGAAVHCSILNAATGPIYIGRNALIMEGCAVRGPLALGEGAVLKMGTKIYGATTLGPYCIGGGEIKNSVFFGYSNKSHDGYVGDAVIGEWCNLGGNTNCSNVKNNAAVVKVWMEAKQATEPAGQKCGVMMGDFSRTGINTMLNTGTVVGVSCNIFGAGFPPAFMPSFSWGHQVGMTAYRLPEALRDAAAWMAFKGRQLEDTDRKVLEAIFHETNTQRP